MPQRTCVACQQIKEKKALIRLVCGPSGLVEVDTSGRKPGRGAYLCSQRTCWEEALRKKRLEHALRTRLDESNRRALLEYSRNLAEEK